MPSVTSMARLASNPDVFEGYSDSFLWGAVRRWFVGSGASQTAKLAQRGVWEGFPFGRANCSNAGKLAEASQHEQHAAFMGPLVVDMVSAVAPKKRVQLNPPDFPPAPAHRVPQPHPPQVPAGQSQICIPVKRPVSNYLSPPV